MPCRIGTLIAFFCAFFGVAGQQPSAFHMRREAANDLEVSGMVRGVPRGASRFISRAWIAGLPRVSMRITENGDYPNLPETGVMVSGVRLSTLVKRLGADPKATVVQAICRDGYVATFPLEYLAQHQPVLIFEVAGMDLGEWARKNKQYDAEPFFIGYERFVPAFHILAHEERPLEPSEIIGLRFDTKERVFAEIAPKRANTDVVQGYRIAGQSCFRCHNAPSSGGTKAGTSWGEVGRIARDQPEHFAAWVRNPQAVDPEAEMPANPTYDAATVTALQRYFAIFAAEGQ